MIGLFFATKAGLRPPPYESFWDNPLASMERDYIAAMAERLDAEIMGTVEPWVPPPPPPPTLWQRIEAWYRGLGNQEDYDY